MKKELLSCFTWLANTLSQGNTYKNWNDEFVREEMDSAFKRFYEAIEKDNLIDFNNLTQEEARALRFCKWDDKSNLMLIPLYMLPLIPKGTELTDIGNNKVIYEGPDSIDTDIRFGCLAYGIVIDK